MEIFFVAIFGAIFGSFVSCVTYRLSTRESMVFVRSKCTICGYKLTAKNLIPIFSFLLQGGMCSSCGAKISARYPFIEATFVIVFLLIFFFSGQVIDQKMVLLCLISSILVAISIVDIEKFFIPDILQYLLTIVATIFVITEKISIMNNVYSAFVYAGFGLLLYVLFYFVRKKEALGIDDIKFLFIAGFLLGFENAISFTLALGLAGTLFGFLWIKIKKDDIFPFAPALCFAVFTNLF
jgi:leader peptidase (prepilin peptidase)/N-methyltransferase